MKSFMLFLLFLFQNAAPFATLDVQVLNAANQPVAQQEVRLQLYAFEQRNQQTVARVWYDETVRTDAQGVAHFEIPAPPVEDILRGAVIIGDQARDVMWPGGPLMLPLRLDQMADGREGSPFEFDPKGGVPIISRSSGLFHGFFALLGVLLLAALTWRFLRQSREQHDA